MHAMCPMHCGIIVSGARAQSSAMSPDLKNAYAFEAVRRGSNRIKNGDQHNKDDSYLILWSFVAWHVGIRNVCSRLHTRTNRTSAPERTTRSSDRRTQHFQFLRDKGRAHA